MACPSGPNDPYRLHDRIGEFESHIILSGTIPNRLNILKPVEPRYLLQQPYR